MIRASIFAIAFAAGAFAQTPSFRINPSAEIQEKGKKKVSEDAQKTAKQALAVLEKGDSVQAKRLFEKVLTLAPGNAPTLINLALIEYRQKHLPDAETLLKSAVKSAPESGLPWLV